MMDKAKNKEAFLKEMAFDDCEAGTSYSPDDFRLFKRICAEEGFDVNEDDFSDYFEYFDACENDVNDCLEYAEENEFEVNKCTKCGSENIEFGEAKSEMIYDNEDPNQYNEITKTLWACKDCGHNGIQIMTPSALENSIQAEDIDLSLRPSQFIAEYFPNFECCGPVRWDQESVEYHLGLIHDDDCHDYGDELRADLCLHHMFSMEQTLGDYKKVKCQIFRYFGDNEFIVQYFDSSDMLNSVGFASITLRSGLEEKLTAFKEATIEAMKTLQVLDENNDFIVSM